MTDELDEIVRKFNRYNKGKGGFDELEMKQAILALIAQAYDRGYADKAIKADEELLDRATTEVFQSDETKIIIARLRSNYE